MQAFQRIDFGLQGFQFRDDAALFHERRRREPDFLNITITNIRLIRADSDDPQTRVVVPVSEDEVQRLQTANIAADENVILEIVANERRFLYHDMPKGGPETLVWKTRLLFIPGHD